MGSFRLDSDATNKIIRLSFEGEESGQVLRGAQAALRSCWERLGPWPCIVDLTGVTDATFPSEDVRTIARIQPVVSMDCLLVAVAPKDVTYGLARMFELLISGEHGPYVRVVHTMDEALKLIGVPTPTFTPIDDDFREIA